MAISTESIMAGPGFAGVVASGRDTPTATVDQQSAPSMYWRLPDGRIQLLKAGQNGIDRMQVGALPLVQYGMVTRATRDNRTDTDEFCVLVERGGIKELSPEQIFGLHWHRPPQSNDTPTHKTLWKQVLGAMQRGLEQREAVYEVLPQLRAAEWPSDVACAYCNGRVFLTEADLHKHESVMHRDDVRTREMRDNITDALRTQTERSGDMTELIQLMAKTLAAVGSQSAETKSMIEELLGQNLPADPAKEKPKR